MVTLALAEGVNLLPYIRVSIGLAHLFEAPGLAAALTEGRTAPGGGPATARVAERGDMSGSSGS
jgi:hypothetical protein